jgi:hypothetical protein
VERVHEVGRAPLEAGALSKACRVSEMGKHTIVGVRLSSKVIRPFAPGLAPVLRDGGYTRYHPTNGLFVDLGPGNPIYADLNPSRKNRVSLRGGER